MTDCDCRFADVDSARVAEIERLEKDNRRLVRDLEDEREKAGRLHEVIDRMGDRIKILEAKAVAARDLLNV